MTITRMIPAADVLGRELERNLRLAEAERDEARRMLRSLVEAIGTPAECEQCGRLVYQVQQSTHDPSGVHHVCGGTTDESC